MNNLRKVRNSIRRRLERDVDEDIMFFDSVIPGLGARGSFSVNSSDPRSTLWYAVSSLMVLGVVLVAVAYLQNSAAGVLVAFSSGLGMIGLTSIALSALLLGATFLYKKTNQNHVGGSTAATGHRLRHHANRHAERVRNVVNANAPANAVQTLGNLPPVPTLDTLGQGGDQGDDGEKRAKAKKGKKTDDNVFIQPPLTSKRSVVGRAQNKSKPRTRVGKLKLSKNGETV
jgi:hypothetical protein